MDVIFFVADIEDQFYIYENFSENRFIEHFKYSLSHVIENLKAIQLREKQKFNSIFDYIGFCNVFNVGTIRGFNLVIDPNIEVLDECKFLCCLLSNRLRSKFFFKIIL